MSQTATILDHMRRYGGITPLQALTHYDCMRLAARINDLRADGHEIRTETVERNGKRWARYVLEERPSQAEMWG